MKSFFKSLKTWVIKASHVLKVIEESVDYRFEDYALDHLKRLEQRVSQLEQKRIAPSSDTWRREYPKAISDSR